MSYRAPSFAPSAYSAIPYGAVEGEDVPAEAPAQSTGEMLTEYAPFLQSILGIDDAADKAARLQGRLSTLKAGGPGAFLMAKSVCGLCSVQTAIERTEDQIVAAGSEADKARARDTMYTALAIAGAAAGGLAVLWLGTKVWGGYQQGRIQQEELKRLQAGS